MSGYETWSRVVHKFGRNTDSDTGDDVWDGSAPYTFPADAGATTIVSDSANDTLLGTGAQIVVVQGLNAEYELVTQTVPLNGTTSQSIESMLRVFRMFVYQAGTGNENAGTITCAIDGVTAAQISTGIGQTLMAIYTLPAGTWGWLQGWRASIDATADVELAFQVKPYREKPKNGCWLTKDVIQLDSTGAMHTEVHFPTFQKYEPKTDFRVRVLSGLTNAIVSSQFDLLLHDQESLPPLITPQG